MKVGRLRLITLLDSSQSFAEYKKYYVSQLINFIKTDFIQVAFINWESTPGFDVDHSFILVNGFKLERLNTWRPDKQAISASGT